MQCLSYVRRFEFITLDAHRNICAVLTVRARRQRLHTCRVRVANQSLFTRTFSAVCFRTRFANIKRANNQSNFT